MRPVIVIVTQDSSGTFVVHDAIGRQHSVLGDDLADLFSKLGNDESLPKAEEVHSKRAKAEMATTRAVEHFSPPLLRPFAQPVAKLFLDKMISLSNARRRRTV